MFIMPGSQTQVLFSSHAISEKILGKTKVFHANLLALIIIAVEQEERPWKYYHYVKDSGPTRYRDLTVKLKFL